MSAKIQLLPVGFGLPLSLDKDGNELSSFVVDFNKMHFVGFCKLSAEDNYVWMTLKVDSLLEFNKHYISCPIQFVSGGNTYKTVPVNKEVFDVVYAMFNLAKSRPGS